MSLLSERLNVPSSSNYSQLQMHKHAMPSASKWTHLAELQGCQMSTLVLYLHIYQWCLVGTTSLVLKT